MADRRKLQGEVDRVLKKVSEGAEAFQDIWQKVQNATNVNQKEKYEAELKREIKKLQRLREQIKTWAASSDIKDKKTLLENRKLIETQMERFRIVEKETKTKAYSKEGLGQANKIDPATQELERTREWLNEAISRLNLQIDQFEAETESLHAGPRKKKLEKDKQDRADELTESVEKHRHHITQLEHILRKLDNESLSVDAVNKVRDDVDYYIDNCQEPDFSDDFADGIYDDLDLDVESELLLEHSMRALEKEDEDDIQSSPGSSVNSGFSAVPSSPISKSVNVSQNNSPRKNSKSSSVNGSISSSSVNTTVTAAVNLSKRNLFPVTNHNTSTPSSTLSTYTNHTDSTVTSSESTPTVNGIDHVIDNPTKFPLPPLSHELTSPYAVAAATPSTPSTLPPTTSQDVTRPDSPQSLQNQALNAAQIVRNHVESLKGFSGFNSVSSAALWKNSDPTSLSSSMSSLSMTSENNGSITTTATDTQPSLETGPSLMSAISRPLPSTISPMLSSSQISSSQSNSSFMNINPLGQKLDSSPLPPQQQPPQSAHTDFSVKANSLFGGVINPTPQLHKPPTSITQEVHLQPVHGVAPLGPVLLTSERLFQLKMVDSAFHHLPQKQDSERMRPHGMTRNAVPIAPYHHHQPPANIDSLEFFQRLSTETLFFIFYYQEGTRAQYLAAKALKKQSWRFHTRHMMWFQRHEEPKRITDEYEEGTYIFFDYEKWSQRRRDGFTFEYRYLEDKDLP